MEFISSFTCCQVWSFIRCLLKSTLKDIKRANRHVNNSSEVDLGPFTEKELDENVCTCLEKALNSLVATTAVRLFQTSLQKPKQNASRREGVEDLVRSVTFWCTYIHRVPVRTLGGVPRETMIYEEGPIAIETLSTEMFCGDNTYSDGMIWHFLYARSVSTLRCPVMWRGEICISSSWTSLNILLVNLRKDCDLVPPCFFRYDNDVKLSIRNKTVVFFSLNLRNFNALRTVQSSNKFMRWLWCFYVRSTIGPETLKIKPNLFLKRISSKFLIFI